MKNINQDFFNLIDKSKHILIVNPLSTSIDALATSFALSRFLEKEKKKVSIFTRNNAPEKISFLESTTPIIKDLSGARDFLLIFNTERNKIIDIKTEERDKDYIIRLTPEKGSIDPRDFSFIPSDFKYDLIITIGIKSLESLGKIYLDNSDLFFEIPKINIDHQSANENFGQFNLIKLTASSCAEIISEMLLESKEEEFNEHIAQSLLTGIIAETESFQKPTTSPKSMMLAAKLMKYKASQSKIIRHLYKTKAFSFMKIWGRIMARLNWDEKNKIAWSLVSSEDFVQSHAGESDIPAVIDEIQKNFSQGEIFIILYSYGTSRTKAQIRTSNSSVRQRLLNDLDDILIETGEIINIEIPEQDLVKAEKILLTKIKDSIQTNSL